jgi:cbb3-type cytochrome oxidase subunit 1
MKKVFKSLFGYNSIIYIGNIYEFNKEEYKKLMIIHYDLIDISFWIRQLIMNYNEKKIIKKIIKNYFKYMREISFGIIQIYQLKYL